MISLAAATTIQKIADSKIAITFLRANVIFILTNYKATLATLIPIYCLKIIVIQELRRYLNIGI
jgi:hypothetical protein